MSTTKAALTIVLERKVESWEMVIQLIVLSCMLIGSVFGNILICICVLVKQEMQTITGMFLVSLALADLGTGIFCIPMAIAAILDRNILHNEVTCNINAFCLVFFFITSINTLVSTALYKYWTVGFPMNHKVTKRKALFIILFAWLTATVLAAGPIFGWSRYYLIRERYQCSPRSPETPAEYSHLIALLIFGYVIPVPLMTFCYARIYTVSKSHFKRMKRNTLSDFTLLESETHLIATLWIVLIVFMLCWLPFVIYLVAGLLHIEIPYYLPILAFTFGYSNSSLNPIVYALRFKSFRKGFKDIILGCFRRQQQDNRLNGKDRGNSAIELEERTGEKCFGKEIDIISLTEMRYETFNKIVKLCQTGDESAPQGEYQILRSIDSQYKIHVIINPSVDEINAYGSPCIFKVFRTMTRKDIYFDSVGNAVMTNEQDISKNEDVNVQDLPLYMKEHARPEGKKFVM